MSTASPVAERTAGPARIGGLRRVLSFPVMLAGLLGVLAVLTVRARFNDPDMWWHLKIGELIWTTHSIPTTDLFSYTTGHHAWIPYEWLAEVVIYGAYRLGGYPGLMLWLCLLSASLLIAAYALCSLYARNAKVGFLGALIIWLFATSGLAIRPQMIGYLLLILELLLLHLGRNRSPHWFFCLPPLFALWVNCHGSFFLGVVVAGVFLLCSFIDCRLGSLASSPWEPRRRYLLGLALMLSIPALFVNPFGLKQVLYPLDTLMKFPIAIGHVQEWEPLQVNSGRGVGLLAVLGCIFLLVAIQRSELLWHELVLLVLGAWFAFNHTRMVFVFGILAAPILSRMLSTSWDGYDIEQDRPVPNALLISISLLVAFLGFPTYRSLAKQVEETSPVRAVEFMKTHHLSGHMLNEYVYGGYLIWAAPEDPVFVDGRGDVFETTGVLADYGRWATLESDPHTLLDKYGIEFCLLGRDSPMAHVLPLLHGWKAIYSDSMSVIFARTSAASPLK
jgi:hypothetical protein